MIVTLKIDFESNDNNFEKGYHNFEIWFWKLMIMLLKTDLKLMIMKINIETGDHDNQSNLSVNNNEAEDVEGKGRKVNLQSKWFPDLSQRYFTRVNIIVHLILPRTRTLTLGQNRCQFWRTTQRLLLISKWNWWRI